jgi:hypothetical protein
VSVEEARARKIAGVALGLAMAGDLEEAARYVKRLDGSNGLVVAIIGWIDTYIGSVYPEHRMGDRIAMRWLHAPSGEVETADDVDPPLRWAGRLISMRAAGDEEGFNLVLRSAPEGAGLGDGIMALLHAVATSIGDPSVCRTATAKLGGTR